jgi:four helix bundle protein
MPAPYEELRAWQVAHEVTVLVFRETEGWPKREWYGLVAHIRKTVVSVPSNLAEGCGKRGNAELRKYVDIALGSYNEVEYQLRLARDLGYLEPDRHEALRPRLDELGKCLYGLVRSLGR